MDITRYRAAFRVTLPLRCVWDRALPGRTAKDNLGASLTGGHTFVRAAYST